jgi:hypothetical protein
MVSAAALRSHDFSDTWSPQIIDAGRRLAGAREHYCGEIEEDTQESATRREAIHGRSSASTGGARWREPVLPIHPFDEARRHRVRYDGHTRDAVVVQHFASRLSRLVD